MELAAFHVFVNEPLMSLGDQGKEACYQKYEGVACILYCFDYGRSSCLHFPYTPASITTARKIRWEKPATENGVCCMWESVEIDFASCHSLGWFWGGRHSKAIIVSLFFLSFHMFLVRYGVSLKHQAML